MNTLLNLMHQVWNRRTPARPVLSRPAVPRRARSAVAAPAAQGDLWRWYQSRCVAEENVFTDK